MKTPFLILLFLFTQCISENSEKNISKGLPFDMKTVLKKEIFDLPIREIDEFKINGDYSSIEFKYYRYSAPYNSQLILLDSVHIYFSPLYEITKTISNNGTTSFWYENKKNLTTKIQDSIVGEYKIDESQRILSIKKQSISYEYIYLDKDSTVIKILKNSKGDTAIKTFFYYNELNNIKQIDEYIYKVLETQTFNEFDDRGRLKQQTIKKIRRQPQIDEIKKTFYNDQDLAITEDFSYEIGLGQMENEYTFDSQGNWNSIVMKTNGEKIYYLTRKINYK